MSRKQNSTRLFLVFLITVIFNHYTNLFADSKIVKNYNKEERTGECTILSKEINVEKDYGIATFIINIPHEGEYYVNAFVNGRIADEKLEFCNVRINGKKSSHILQFKKAQWHMAKIVDKNNIPSKLKLDVGKNTISFLTKLPFIPEIEFVRLSMDIKRVDINSEEYDKYVNILKKNDISTINFSSKIDTTSLKSRSTSSNLSHLS